MTQGVIVSHCFNNMVSEKEQEAFTNIKNLITNYQGPILGSLNEREDIKNLLPVGSNLEDDLNYLNYENPNRHKAPDIIYEWIKDNNVQTIYLVGCHYNLCIRGVYNAIELASQKLPKPWQDTFQAFIIEECTAILLDDDIVTVNEYAKAGNEIYNVIPLTQIDLGDHKDNFVRLQVVERELVDFHSFDAEFKKRVELNQYPIRVKINEGPDLDYLKVGDTKFVDYLTSLTGADNIEIETDNLIEKNEQVKIIKWFNHLPFLAYQNNESLKGKNLEKKIMHFVGNHRWPRFVLSQWLHANHRDTCLLTYWFTHNYLDNPEWGTDQLLEYMTSEQIQEHNNILPLTINTDENKDHPGYIDWKFTSPLLPFYNTAFVDLVCETWHEGHTFMPTEKIARPLITKNPFIVYGPKHFLKNLRQLGFKTFDDFWSESYDNDSGTERINKIKIILDQIINMSMQQLTKLYQDMLPTLEHNLTVYNNMTHKEIMKVFDK